MSLLTVLMPAYNAELHIDSAIGSILAQSLSDFELLVLDDGSEDATAARVERIAAFDSRVRLLKRGRQGQVASRNELLASARTDIIAWADADDISLPGRLAQQYAAMQARPEIDVLGTMMTVIDVGGRPVGRKSNPMGAERVAQTLEERVAVSQTSMMLRRRLAQDVGYRPAYETAEDYDFLLRIKERGRLDNLDSYAVLYRENPSGVSWRNPAKQLFAADMARATHRLRRGGKHDPTSALEAPPDIDDPLLDALLPDDMAFHRTMRKVATADARTAEGILKDLLSLRITRRRERIAQRAAVSLVRLRRFDMLSLRASAFALALGPRRYLELMRAKSV